jgi:hypothetical protein
MIPLPPFLLGAVCFDWRSDLRSDIRRRDNLHREDILRNFTGKIIDITF